MEFIDLIHNPQGEILDFDPDIFIAASGFESRSIVIPKAFLNIQSKKIAFAFKEHSKELKRPINDSFYKENGFELILTSGSEAPDFRSAFLNINKEEIKVLVDISVMTKKWYHSFLKYLGSVSGYKSIIVRMAYCPAYYTEPVRRRKNISLEKFIMQDKVRERVPSQKKTALIMGLGNEKGVSQAVFEMIKPDQTILLYADPTIQKEYVENVYINNHELINALDIRDLAGYPLNDTSSIYKLLIDHILPLRKDYRIVIVPQGPKIFSLITIIVQMSYPDIELIYPRFKARQIKDRRPFQEFTFLDVLFGTE